MRVTREEQRIAQLAKHHAQTSQVGPMSCGGLWGKVRRFPGRVVSVHTGIRRVREGESLEKACTRPPDKASGRQRRAYHKNPAFLRQVESDIPAKQVAANWGVSESTIFKRRQQLRKLKENHEQATRKPSL
jgi:hypothetical protein